MKLIAIIMQAAIRLYRYALAPLFPVGGCRFHPSCSEYAIEAIDRHGPFGGGWLAIKRITRCHPWGPTGRDPVPGAGAGDPRPLAR